MAIHPFHIQISDEQIEYLQGRIRSTRWPSSIFAYGWEDGTNLDFLKKLSRCWEHDFRWRDHEERLNLLPQFRVTIDGCDIHFVHQKGKGPAPLPLILTHGWPGSFAEGELERVIPLDTLLTDISLYWFGNTIEASLRIYKENRLCPLVFGPGERITPPLGVAIFPRELLMPPRSWVERVFRVERWTDMPKGGHFATIEQPELLVDDIRAFFRLLRLRPTK